MGQNSPKYSKNNSKQGLERLIRPCRLLFFALKKLFDILAINPALLDSPTIEYIEMGAVMKGEIEAAKATFRKVRDDIMDGTTGSDAAQKVAAVLEKIKANTPRFLFSQHDSNYIPSRVFAQNPNGVLRFLLQYKKSCYIIKMYFFLCTTAWIFSGSKEDYYYGCA